MKRYHDDFPSAPVAMISGISGACLIPSIVGARVGRDGSAYLDIYVDDNFAIDIDRLHDIANFFQVPDDEVQVEPGPSPETVTVTVCSSGFDFSAQFERRLPLPGEGDSEESVEAHASTVNRRI